MKISLICLLVVLILATPVSSIGARSPGRPGPDGARFDRGLLPAGWTAVSGEWSGDGADIIGTTRLRDLNDDGYQDLVISNFGLGSDLNIDSYIYWGSASGFSTSSRTGLPTMGATGNAVADFNGDGYLDIVFANSHDAHGSSGLGHITDSYIYWNSASGFSASSRTLLPSEDVYGIAVADLDFDGYPDLVFANVFDGTTMGIDSFIYWGSASGYSAADRTDLPTMGAVACSVADLDNDGYLDLVFSNYGGASSYIYWGSASGYSTADRTSLSASSPHGNCIADLNDDGYPDIVFANSGGGNSRIYWGSAGGYSADSSLDLPTRSAHGVSVADLDADGHPDIVFSNFNGDSNIYWGSATGYSSADRSDLGAGTAYGNSVADLDSDGYLDITFSNYQSTGSKIFWGSASGYSSGDTTTLATYYPVVNTAVMGNIPTGNTGYSNLPAYLSSIALNDTLEGDSYSMNCIVDFTDSRQYLDIRGGMVFGYRDENNYDYAVLNPRADTLEVFTVSGGRTVRLGFNRTNIDFDTDYVLGLELNGGDMEISLDGSPVLSLADPGLATGRWGLYSWNGRTRFLPLGKPVQFAGLSYSPLDVSERDTVTLAASFRNPNPFTIDGPVAGIRQGDDFENSTLVAEGTLSIPARSTTDFNTVWTALGGRRTVWATLDGIAVGSLDITVNRYPELEPICDQLIKAETFFTMTLNASDPDGDWLNWTANTTLFSLQAMSNCTARIDFTPGKGDVGRHVITATVTDTHRKSASRSFKITVTRINHPPVLETLGDRIAYEDVQISFKANASDEDIPFGDWLSFSDNSSLFDIDPVSGHIDFSPSQEDVGAHLVTVTVTDGSGLNDSSHFLLTVQNVNDPPILSREGTRYLMEDVQYRGRINASDPDLEVDPNERLIFSAQTALFSIDYATGLIQFTPKKKDAGTHLVNITVKDAAGLSDTAAFVFVIALDNDPPALAAIPDLVALEDTAFEYAVAARDNETDLGLDKLEFWDDCPLFTIAGNGTISFVPTNDDVGEYNVTVKVSDGYGLNASRTFHLTVQNVNDPPYAVRILSPYNASRLENGKKVMLEGDGKDVDKGDVLVFCWFDNGKFIGAGRSFRYSPAPGKHLIMLEVSDGEASVQDEVNVTVYRKEDLVISGTPWILVIVLMAVIMALSYRMYRLNRKTHLAGARAGAPSNPQANQPESPSEGHAPPPTGGG